jgi:flagellar hook-associated protein 2
MLSGVSGVDGTFAVTSSVSDDLGFGDTDKKLQSSQDAIVNYDGLTITRGSNQIADVISGATISLNATTSESIRLTITSDTGTLKTSLRSVVTAYNELQSLIKNLGTESSASTDAMNGALANESGMLNQLKSTIRSAIFADSGTKAGNINALRDIGISLSQTGNMTFNETRFTSAAASDYTDIVTMLTANTTDQNLFSTTEKGLSQDIATVLDDLTASTGLVAVRAKGADTIVLSHKAELETLEARMEAVYQRYLKQFAAMETIMASMDTTKDYLTGQLETLSKAYDK